MSTLGVSDRPSSFEVMPTLLYTSGITRLVPVASVMVVMSGAVGHGARYRDISSILRMRASLWPFTSSNEPVMSGTSGSFLSGHVGIAGRMTNSYTAIVRGTAGDHATKAGSWITVRLSTKRPPTSRYLLRLIDSWTTFVRSHIE